MGWVKDQLTSILVLVHGLVDQAPLCRVDGLSLQARAPSTHAARSVHGALERVALPSENVVGVLAESGVVSRAEVEGLGPVLGPQRAVVELSGVPDDLVHELWDPDGVRRRAAAAEAQEVGRARRRVGHVVLVVRSVQVLSVPATMFQLAPYALINECREVTLRGE